MQAPFHIKYQRCREFISNDSSLDSLRFESDTHPRYERDGSTIAAASMHNLLRFTDLHGTRAAVGVGLGFCGSWERIE